MTVLLREAIGDRLRHARTNQRRTLREISHSARVSLGYLSEVERGQKEASSELLAAICDALALPLSELLFNVASDITALETVGIDEAGLDRAGLDRAGLDRAVEKSPGDGRAEMSVSAGTGGPSLRSTIVSPKVIIAA